MIILLVVFTFSNLTAQEGLKSKQQLNDVKLTYLKAEKVRVKPKNVRSRLGDEHKKQFLRNPVKFCDEKIDVTALIESMNSKNNKSFVVKLQNSQGYIKATYNREGELQSTYQKFKDIIMPKDLQKEIFLDYKGWTITKTRYIAYGKGDKVNREKWLIGLSKGNSTKNVKINPTKISKEGLAVY